MSLIPTVRGPVQTADLGPTYMHEHIFVRTADVQLVEMCRRGYAERMVLSQDASCYIDWIDPNILPFLPQWHYLHIHDEVLPYAREHGVTQEQVTAMLTANPRRFFEQGPG